MVLLERARGARPLTARGPPRRRARPRRALSRRSSAQTSALGCATRSVRRAGRGGKRLRLPPSSSRARAAPRWSRSRACDGSVAIGARDLFDRVRMMPEGKHLGHLGAIRRASHVGGDVADGKGARSTSSPGASGSPAAIRESGTHVDVDVADGWRAPIVSSLECRSRRPGSLSRSGVARPTWATTLAGRSDSDRVLGPPITCSRPRPPSGCHEPALGVRALAAGESGHGAFAGPPGLTASRRVDRVGIRGGV